MIDSVRLLRTPRLKNQLKQKLLKISYLLELPTVDAIIIIIMTDNSAYSSEQLALKAAMTVLHPRTEDRPVSGAELHANSGTTKDDSDIN